MSNLPPGRYRHFKGMEYEVLGTATHSETGEPLVVYRALYGGHGLFVRPAAMFAESVSRHGYMGPRFTRVGPAETRQLAREAQLRARHFLMTEGRPLERALYAFHFEGGEVGDVYSALAAYGNGDGGFGHALEPDLGTPDSSVLATTTALQVLRSVGAGPEQPLVAGAIDYLVRTWDDTARRWPYIPPTANNAPHAPWWSLSGDHPALFGGYRVNPFTEVVAHLLHYRPDAPLLAQALLVEAALENVAALPQPLNMHEILCVLRLIETDALDESAREQLAAALAAALPSALATTPDQWESYGLQPVQAAPHPHSPWAGPLAELVSANLDFLIDDQNENGSWSPTWTWGHPYPDEWPQARRDWQSILTLHALYRLAAWGRFAL